MPFGHHHNKAPHHGDSMWTSYADLFLGLSVVFLLLYVTASLRQGTDGIRQHIDNKQLARENEDLKQQLKVYTTIKQHSLENEASPDEQKQYEMLMSKLDLLQEEANNEKERLQQAANDNAQKEKALNQYQQMIRNIINSNIIAKSRIKNRDLLITKKEDTIEGQSQEIQGLQVNLNQKRQEVEKNERKIEALNSDLQNQLNKLKAAYHANHMTEKMYQKKQDELKRQSEEKVQALVERNRKSEQELAALDEKLRSQSQENSALQTQIDQLQKDYASQKDRDRRNFEEQLRKERLSGARLAEREAQFRKDTEKKAQELAQRIADAEKKFQNAQGQVQRLKGDLAQAQENLNARKKLAEAIRGRFAAGGVKADVDGKTGDVLLSFEGEYFDNGDATLKPGMRQVLEKAMPNYAQSLFEDARISKKIENVEIIGFASPTYKGRYVDPATLSNKDREAVNYNLDLSYGRAKAIFDHMLTRMQFEHKQPLLRLVKVTGRSFLNEHNDRKPAGESQSQFCQKTDCAKQRTVIIRFKLKD